MAGGITSTVELSFGMEKVTSVLALKSHPYGTRGVLPDGRVFRYAFSNGAFTAGRIMQAAVQPHGGENDMDLPISSAGNAIGDQNVDVDFTTGISTILEADEYEDGKLYVNDGPGEGHLYRISSHSSQTSDFATAMPFKLADDDQIRSTALTTLSLVGLIKNQYKDVVGIDLDVTYTNVVGATPVDVDDNRNFWLQTYGEAAILVADNATVPALGRGIQPQLTTSDIVGAVSGIDTSLSSDAGAEPDINVPIIGYSLVVAAVDTDYGYMFLQISP